MRKFFMFLVLVVSFVVMAFIVPAFAQEAAKKSFDIQSIIDLIKANWLGIIAIWLAFIKLLQAIRDAIDKTPASDDNWFERLVTILGKTIAQLTIAKRAS